MISGGGGGKEKTEIFTEEEIMQMTEEALETIKDFHRKSFYNSLYDDFRHIMSSEFGISAKQRRQTKKSSALCVHLDT